MTEYERSEKKAKRIDKLSLALFHLLEIMYLYYRTYKKKESRYSSCFSNLEIGDSALALRSHQILMAKATRFEGRTYKKKECSR